VGHTRSMDRDAPGVSRLLAALDDGTRSGADPVAVLQELSTELRELLGAAACSVALADPDELGLTFVAAAGAGAKEILGVRIPIGNGIAGWAVSAGQAVSVRDVPADVRFARGVAEETGYVPQRISAVPVLARDGTPLAVIEVLDQGTDRGTDWGTDDPAGRPGDDGGVVLDVLGLVGERVGAMLRQSAVHEQLAWAAPFHPGRLAPVRALPLPPPVRDWAWAGATGAGVKVAVLDTGVDAGHPRVGEVAGFVDVEVLPDGGTRLVPGPHEDRVGHGTACASLVRALAPQAEIYSVRVLGPNLRAPGAAFAAGIRWALDAGMQVLNLSLSSSSETWFGPLHELADEAAFRNVMLVCAANNRPGPTYPSQFSSVLSVAARTGTEPLSIAYNPRPPVEFAANGVDVDVAWPGGGSVVASGNSFAAAHMSGLVARMLSRRPWLTPFQVKSVLHAAADNATTTAAGQ
jgi:subtilisin